jgi:polar amino acid transport system substrate-binding protein
MSSKSVLWGCVLWFGLIASTWAEASHKPHFVVVYTDWKPYGYMEDGLAKGFEIDVFREVAERMGTTVEFQNCPWKRCLKMVEKGKADVLVSALRTPERETFLHFPIESISVSETALFTKKDAPLIGFNGGAEYLKGLKVGVTSGFSYGDSFDKDEGIIKLEARSTEQVVKMFMVGRSDLIIGNIAVINSITKELEDAPALQPLFPLVHSNELYAAFSKKVVDSSLVSRFSKVLAEFKQTEEFQRILKTHSFR